MGAAGAIAAVLFFAHAAQGERAYLPVVGSPPLRFMAINTNDFVFKAKFSDATAKPVNTNSSAANAATLPAVQPTNNVEAARQIPAAIAEAQRPSEKMQPVEDENKNAAEGYNPDFSSPSASDMLTVTPQMINQYLRPGRYRGGNGTNEFDQPGAVVFVPAQMQFTPPAPKNSAESQAIYRSQ